tara:strand:+ start:355 stop:477 length:123 start_codon:yes stop_codon:yes gene_type:complete
MEIIFESEGVRLIQIKKGEERIKIFLCGIVLVRRKFLEKR